MNDDHRAGCRWTRPAVAAILAIALGACAAEPGDVLLITADTLRVDRVGLHGAERGTTTNLDRWFADGAIYDRSYATSAATPPSVISILSGRLPQEHRVRTFYQLLGDDVELLTDRLPPEYQTAAVVSNTVLTEEAVGMDGRFDFYDDYVDERESIRPVYERNAGRSTDVVLHWLRQRADPERPVFVWIHYIDPHGPYRPPSAWKRHFEHGRRRQYVEPERFPDYMRHPDIDDALTYIDHYDEEVAYLDHHVGRLLEGWRRLRSLDDTLVIFTSDHGETLTERDRWFQHGYHVYEEIVRVPLLLRGPGVAPGRRSVLASGIDVAPTILRFAGASVADLKGFDLRRGEIPEDRAVFAESVTADHQWRAALVGTQKWVLGVAAADRRILVRRAFDLADDPEEQHPTPWREAPVADSLVALVESDPDPAGVPLLPRLGTLIDGPKLASGAPNESEERLRSLGYVE